MRAVVQRVRQAAVHVDDEPIGEIDGGLMVLLGVTHEDDEQDARWLAEKIVHLRIFEDEAGKMNRSLIDVGGSLLAVSQFTLYGDCRRGRRPSFTEAAAPETANRLYEVFCQAVQAQGVALQTGQFQAHMIVSLENDGPVTLLLSSPQKEASE